MALDPQLAVRNLVRADRSVRSILVAVFALDVLTTLIVTGYGNSYLLKTLDAPPSYPAFALGVYGFVKLVTAPMGGRLTDRARPAISVALAGALQAGGIGIMLVVGTAKGFIVGAGVLSAGTTLMWLLVFRALAVSVAPAGRGSATAYLGLTSVSAVGLGFAAAALLAEAGSAVVFVTGIVFGCGSAVLLWRVSVGAADLRARREVAASAREASVPRRVEAIAGGVAFTHSLAVSATFVAFSPFALDLLDLTLLKLGALLAPAAIAGGLTMLAAGRRSLEGQRLREAAPLYALGAVALLLTAFTSHWGWFGLGMTALGVAIGGTTPLLTSIRIDLSTATAAPGQLLGGLIFAEGLGSVAGPVVVGLVISAGDIRAGALVAGIAFAVLALLSGVAARTVRL